MSRLKLVLSILCIITLCHVLPAAGAGSSYVSPDLDLKATRAWLNGKHLIIGTLIDGLRSNAIFDDNGKLLGNGIAFEIIKEFCDRFNFTYEIIIPPSSFDIRNKTLMESWLLELLTANKIDIAAAFITFTMDRKDLVTFALEMDTINCLVSPKPLNGQYVVNNTLQPFDLNVWFVFLTMLAFYVTCLTLLTKLRSKLLSDGEESFTVSLSFWYAFRVLTNQDVRQSQKSSMTRILLITWSICVFLVSTYYGAHLSRGHTLTAVAHRSVTKSALKLMEATDKYVLDYKDASDCYSMVTLDRYLTRPSGFAYPRNSNLSVLFEKELKRMYHRGFLKKVNEINQLFINTICSSAPNTDMHQLSSYDLKEIYYCWVTGAGAAIVILIVELLLKRLTSLKIMSKPPESEQANQIDSVASQELSSLCAPAFRLDSFPMRQSSDFQRRTVNGREYLVARTRGGDIRLVPVDTLSGLLYDLNLYETV